MNPHRDIIRQNHTESEVSHLFAVVHSAAIEGLSVRFIRVETDMSEGLPSLSLIGYLGNEVREAGLRVRTALQNIGVVLPPMHTVVNLAPADLPKRGTQFDLPIAISIASALKNTPENFLNETLIIGEINLDGRIGPIPGVLLIARKAGEAGYKRIILPKQNEAEALLVPGICVCGAADLWEALSYVAGGMQGTNSSARISQQKPDYTIDFSDVHGQAPVKRAALISAAGYHNFLLIGPPGAGKTMIAQRLPTIMPPMTFEECMELTEIYSVADMLDGTALITNRPFRAPHHSATGPALVGSSNRAKPGEITLAHHGILFLDEFAEFPRGNLELLRQPLEDHQVLISRARSSHIYPADFLLAAAMNPCPCGWAPNYDRCHCKEGDIRRYLSKVSGPLLDRIDLCVRTQEIPYSELNTRGKDPMDSASMAHAVHQAWQIQQDRYKDESYHYNGRIPGKDMARWCRLSDTDTKLMEDAYQRLNLSARSYHRILRVARTIADLEGMADISTDHLLEALGYRGNEVLFS